LETLWDGFIRYLDKSGGTLTFLQDICNTATNIYIEPSAIISNPFNNTIPSPTTCSLLTFPTVINCETSNSIKENSLNSHIVVYPNPSSGQITIKLLDKKQAVDEIEIYNEVGQLVFSKKISSLTQIIDKDLAKGLHIYFLKNSSSLILKNKLIIE